MTKAHKSFTLHKRKVFSLLLEEMWGGAESDISANCVCVSPGWTCEWRPRHLEQSCVSPSCSSRSSTVPENTQTIRKLTKSTEQQNHFEYTSILLNVPNSFVEDHSEGTHRGGKVTNLREERGRCGARKEERIKTRSCPRHRQINRWLKKQT